MPTTFTQTFECTCGWIKTGDKRTITHASKLHYKIAHGTVVKVPFMPQKGLAKGLGDGGERIMEDVLMK